MKFVVILFDVNPFNQRMKKHLHVCSCPLLVSAENLRETIKSYATFQVVTRKF